MCLCVSLCLCLCVVLSQLGVPALSGCITLLCFAEDERLCEAFDSVLDDLSTHPHSHSMVLEEVFFSLPKLNKLVIEYLCALNTTLWLWS